MGGRAELTQVRRSAHLRLFVMATAVWIAFWIAGLPSYYQQYSVEAMLWFETILLFVVIVVVYYVLRRVAGSRRGSVARWIAFYFTVPLAFYDWLYCGVYLGHGGAFLWRYWYLSTYYVIPWLVLPGIAWSLQPRLERHPTSG